MSSASSWPSTSNSALALALAFALFGAPARAAEGQGVGITAPSGSTMAADPGQVLSLALRVASTSDGALDLRETVELPAGWRQIGALPGLALRPDGADVRLVLVSVPPTTQAGAYTVTYTVSDRLQPATRASATVQVQVRSVSGVGVAVDPRLVPEFLLAGEAAEVPITITNHGNHAARFLVEATGEDRLLVDVSEREVALAAGASAEVRISARTSREDTQATYRAVKVRVWDAAGGAEERIAVPLTILPASGERVAPYRTVPGFVGLRAVQDGDDLRLQAEIGARGALDADGRYRIDVLARGPDAVEAGAFGLRDELRLSLSAPFGQLQLGDQQYGATWLTHPGRYGRGAGATFERDGVLASAYHVASRFDGGAHQDTGLRAGHAVGERGSVSAQVLHTVDRLAGTEDTVASVQSALSTAAGAQLTAEVGMDAGTEGEGPDAAVRLAGIAGKADRAQLAFDGAYGGADYSGFLRDVAQANATLSLGFGKALGARVVGQTSHRNLELRPERGTAPVDQRIEGRATVRLPAQWTLEPGAAAARHEERLAGVQGAYAESAGLLAVSRTGSAWSLLAESRLGPHTDADRDLLLSQHTAFLTVRPGGDRTVGAWATYGSRPAATSALFSSGSTLGVSAAGPIVGRLDLFAAAQRTLDEKTRTQLDATLRLRPRLGPTVTGRVRATWLGGAPQLASELGLQQAIGAPIAKARALGTIEGTLLDGGRPDRPGLAGVMVSAGGRVAVTDRSGRFAIAGLPPGAYALQLDRRTLGPGLVAEDRLPEALEVRGGDETAVQIVLVPAARVVGHARILGAPDAGDLVADRVRGAFGAVVEAVEVAGSTQGAGPLAGVLVQISDGAETLTRMTAADGSFSFEGLRPGEWRATLPSTQVPALYQAVATEQMVGLEPGEAESVELTVRPVLRRVRMEAAAAIVVQAAPASPPIRKSARKKVAPKAPTPAAPDPRPWLAPAAAIQGRSEGLSPLTPSETRLVTHTTLWVQASPDRAFAYVSDPAVRVRLQPAAGRAAIDRVMTPDGHGSIEIDATALCGQRVELAIAPIHAAFQVAPDWHVEEAVFVGQPCP